MQVVLFNDGQPIEWGKPDSFATAAMCALSMCFPNGEKFFAESLQKGYKDLSKDLKKKWKPEIDRFCKEEEAHSRGHESYNHKSSQLYGFVNGWGDRLEKRSLKMEGKNAKHHVATTAACEHITTFLACWLLQNQHILKNADVETRKLWIWHSREELGHRKVAIDMYRDMGGSEEWRIKWMRIMYTLTLIEFVRQTISNIWQMGGFFKLSTWVNGCRILFGKGGVISWAYPYLKAYGQQNYHIEQHDALIEMALKAKD